MSRFFIHVTCVLCLMLVVPLSAFASEQDWADAWKDSIHNALLRGDSLGACRYYTLLQADKDSLAHVAYRGEVKSYRDEHQIDELHLENTLKEQQLLERSVLFASIFVILIVALFFYMRFENKRLERSRLKAQQLKLEAEESMEAKRQLLSDTSGRMHVLLDRIERKASVLGSLDYDDSGREEIIAEMKETSKTLENLYRKSLSNHTQADPQ